MLFFGHLINEGKDIILKGYIAPDGFLRRGIDIKGQPPMKFGAVAKIQSLTTKPLINNINAYMTFR